MKSVELIKRLRQLTGSPIVQCKAALEATENDIEASLEWLRAKGHASAQKKTGLTVSQGLVGCQVVGEKTGLIEVLCGTDFVAKNERFIEYAQWALECLIQKGAVEGEEAEERRISVINATQENVLIRRTSVFLADPGTFVARYVHNAINDSFGKQACMVKIGGDVEPAVQTDIGEKLCMQVVAGRPQYLDRDVIPEAFVAQQREAVLTALTEEGKTADQLGAEKFEKIVQGKLNKKLDGHTFLNQPFLISDDEKEVAVRKYVETEGKGAKILDFAYFSAGEDLEFK